MNQGNARLGFLVVRLMRRLMFPIRHILTASLRTKRSAGCRAPQRIRISRFLLPLVS